MSDEVLVKRWTAKRKSALGRGSRAKQCAPADIRAKKYRRLLGDEENS